MEELKFLDPELAEWQLEVLSTNSQRTRQSAKSNLHGLLPPGSGKRLDSGERKRLTSTEGAFKVRNKAALDAQLLNDSFALPAGFNPVPVFNFGHASNPLADQINPWSCLALDLLVAQYAYETLDTWLLTVAKYALV